MYTTTPFVSLTLFSSSLKLELMSVIDLTVEIIDLTNCTEIESNDESNDECCICYSKLSSSKTIKLSCGHVFHGKCIRRWSKKKKECPLDRKAFKLSELGSSSSANSYEHDEFHDRVAHAAARLQQHIAAQREINQFIAENSY